MGYLDTPKKKSKKHSAAENSFRAQGSQQLTTPRTQVNSAPPKRAFGRRSGTK